jgi:hypothetical protein
VFADVPTTRWTQIHAAKGSAEKQRELWNAVFRVYWRPLFCMARAKGVLPSAAEDAIQSFAERAFSSALLEHADESRGRLRSYLATSFANHLATLHEHAGAEKRGGRVLHVDIDSGGFAEAIAHNTDPLSAFERSWAESTAAEARRLLCAEHVAERRAGDIALLRCYLEGTPLPPLADLAQQNSLTVAFLKSFFYRGKQRYRELLRVVVTDTLGPGETAEEELAHVLRSLST